MQENYLHQAQVLTQPDADIATNINCAVQLAHDGSAAKEVLPILRSVVLSLCTPRCTGWVTRT